MYRIQNITEDAFQQQTVVLFNGNSMFLQLYFMPMQYAWVITELTYQNFTINGLRICNSPNMLQQFKNKLPFGLACKTAGGREPSLQQDFSSGASSLYILTDAEVEYYSTLLASGSFHG